MLNAIYEEDFLGFSYGFRPKRGQHDAMDALSVAISNTPVNSILDADIKGFFDAVNQDWLIRFLEHRIGDERIIRLVKKWLKAGVLEMGQWQSSDMGTPQGAVISPLLANICKPPVATTLARKHGRVYRPTSAAGRQRVGNNSSMRLLGWVGKRVSTSVR